MRNKQLFVFALFLSFFMKAQVGLTPLLTSGVEDAQRFTESYLNPGLDAIAYSLSNGWNNSAETKKLGQFEIAFIGNASFVSASQQTFQLNTADYNFLQFQDGSTVKNVGNVLGQNDPAVGALAVFQDENGNEQSVSFNLPQGIASSGVNFVPTAMLQASVGLPWGLEVKGRYLPEVDTDDGGLKFYGFGLQNEITDWVPGADLLPIHISAAVNYTRFDGNIALSETGLVSGSSQRITTYMDAWAVDALVSTKLKIINFYGGIGYVRASSSFGMLGEYIINDGVNQSQSIIDPFTTSSSVEGLRGTLGFKLSLAFFRIFADYSIQEFNTLSAGIAFGI